MLTLMLAGEHLHDTIRTGVYSKICTVVYFRIGMICKEVYVKLCTGYYVEISMICTGVYFNIWTGSIIITLI